MSRLTVRDCCDGMETLVEYARRPASESDSTLVGAFLRANGVYTDSSVRFSLMGVHRLGDRIQQAVAEPPAGQHSEAQGLEPYA